MQLSHRFKIAILCAIFSSTASAETCQEFVTRIYQRGFTLKISYEGTNVLNVSRKVAGELDYKIKLPAPMKPCATPRPYAVIGPVIVLTPSQKLAAQFTTYQNSDAILETDADGELYLAYGGFDISMHRSAFAKLLKEIGFNSFQGADSGSFVKLAFIAKVIPYQSPEIKNVLGLAVRNHDIYEFAIKHFSFDFN